MSDRDARQLARGKNKKYYTNLADLRRGHRRLFEKEGRFTIVQRVISNPSSNRPTVGVLEGCLRVAAGEEKLREKVVKSVLTMKMHTEEDSPIQVGGLYCGIPM